MKAQSVQTLAPQTATIFSNILFATDFSPAAAHAIPYYDANVVALYVRPPVVNPMVPPSAWPDEAAIRNENEKLRQRLVETFAGIHTTALIEEGDLMSCAQETISNNNVDLVVLGTRGRAGLRKVLLGSVAEEIFRTVRCPVLTVGPHSNSLRAADGGMREILCATDLTSSSPAPVDYALSLAQEFQARLVLVHVIAAPKPNDPVAPCNVAEAAMELLRRLVPAEARAWCQPEFVAESGNVAERILELAYQRKSELIVLGVKAEEGIPGAATHLPIATAHKVVSLAECPVLTVRQ
jgi:nucleotide-binding universal stress UspA family protein